jgi:type IV pilus secretin PilQ/predicted competence protein
MAGMKIRFTRIRNLASSKAKGGAYGILLFLLALAVPRFANSQDRPDLSVSVRQHDSESLSKDANVGDSKKENSGGTVAEALSIGAITDVKMAHEDDKVVVTVSTDGSIAPTEAIVEDPPRLVLDFSNAANKVPFIRLPVHAAFIKRIRIAQFQGMPSPIARVVFDLEEGYGDHQITVDKSLVRIVFPEKPAESASARTRTAVKPATSSVGTHSKSTTPEVQPNRPLPAQLSKAEAGEQKTKQAEVSKSKAAQALPAAAQTVPVVRHETSNTPASSSNPEPSAVVKPATGSAEAHSKSTTPEIQLNRPLPAQPPKAEASEQKTKQAEVSKSKAAQALPAAAQTVPVASHETPNIHAAGFDPKPRTLEPDAKQSLAKAPLVAALTTASIVPPPKMVMFPNSRFSGQPLTLDLVDMPLVDFFRLMAEEGGINIVMDPEIKGRISIKVVKVPWDQIFEAALANHSLDKQVEGSLVRIARKSTLQEEAKQQESLKKANLLAADLETSIKRLNYAKADSLVDALEDQKTVRGTVVVDERTNSLILTDIPSSINKLTKLIETLDIPQPQVEIEARIVSATRDFARDIGIQFGFVQGNLQRVTVGGPNTFGTIGGTRPSATPSSTYAAGNPFTGRGAADDQITESAAISTGTDSNDKGNYNVNLPAGKAFGGLGISVGNIFDTFLLDAAITAGESKGLAKLISQPKVTAQNNSPATITQGLRFPVQIIANNTISVQFQNAALTLVVTPQITYEGNIVLDLKVENNTPDFARQVNGIPSIRTSESTTRVLVSDGGTTVIGGILVDNESSAEDKVPGLGSLPLVGNLFRRTAVSRSTQEVLFFVTPRIIK